VTCRSACRSHRFVFAAVVALSAVAFVGQALAASASTEMTTVAAHAAALAAPR